MMNHMTALDIVLVVSSLLIVPPFIVWMVKKQIHRIREFEEKQQKERADWEHRWDHFKTHESE